jgi:DNA polymerase-1
MDKVLLIDGNNILHRSYHALASSALTSPMGDPIWAVHGLFNTLAKQLKFTGAKKFLIAFDSPETTVRKNLYPFYKGTRKPAADDLKAQLALAYKLAVECKFGACVIPGWEADDIIASATTDSSNFYYILSSDRDAHQLLAPNVSIIKPEGSYMRHEDFSLAYGFPSEFYRHYAAIVGESSDNINGVKGLGEKAAITIINSVNNFEKLSNLPLYLKELKGVLSPRQFMLLEEGVSIYQRNLQINQLNSRLPVSLEDLNDLSPFNYQETFFRYGLVKISKLMDELVDNTLF